MLAGTSIVGGSQHSNKVLVRHSMHTAESGTRELSLGDVNSGHQAASSPTNFSLPSVSHSSERIARLGSRVVVGAASGG